MPVAVNSHDLPVYIKIEFPHYYASLKLLYPECKGHQNRLTLFLSPNYVSASVVEKTHWFRRQSSEKAGFNFIQNCDLENEVTLKIGSRSPKS